MGRDGAAGCTLVPRNRRATCGVVLRVAAMATPWPLRMSLTVLCRPKCAQPRLVKDALSLAAMKVNRLLPVAGAGDGKFCSALFCSLRNGVWMLSMSWQNVAAFSFAMAELSVGVAPLGSRGWPTLFR